MPFKSQAQRRKFAQLLVEGKISPETYEEWNRETGSRKLPERLKRSVKSTRKRTARKRVSARRKR
jgi:macrodomain Ter protein organizer (MatP/YcbG family)